MLYFLEYSTVPNPFINEDVNIEIILAMTIRWIKRSANIMAFCVLLELKKSNN